MKKLITSTIILALLATGCSTPEQEPINECECYKVYYQYEVYYQGGAWQWVYIETSSELYSQSGNCQETDYTQITGGMFYRIECR